MKYSTVLSVNLIILWCAQKSFKNDSIFTVPGGIWKSVRTAITDYTVHTYQMNVAEVVQISLVVFNGTHDGQVFASSGNNALKKPWFPKNQKLQQNVRSFKEIYDFNNSPITDLVTSRLSSRGRTISLKFLILKILFEKLRKNIFSGSNDGGKLVHFKSTGTQMFSRN